MQKIESNILELIQNTKKKSFTRVLFATKAFKNFINFNLKRCFVATSRQLRRMESASFSPILSILTESQAGSSTIRAYKAEQRFISLMHNLVDENFVFEMAANVSDRWLGISNFYKLIGAFN